MKIKRFPILLLCLLVTTFLIADFSLSEDPDLEERVKNLEEEMKELKEENKELKAKVEKLENEAANDRKPNHFMNLIQNIPYVGDAANFVYGLVAPTEYCDNNCGALLWNSNDHKRYCKQIGHQGGILCYYDCHDMYSFFCPKPEEHIYANDPKEKPKEKVPEPPDKTPDCDDCTDGCSSCNFSDATPNCDDCTDADPNCPNASAH